MSDHSDQPALLSPPPDACLLLRADAEQHWLCLEVLPVLCQLETREHLPEEQLGAALAYLEVIWVEALRRAKETNATHSKLDTDACAGELTLSDKARSYHAAVRALFEAVAERVSSQIATSAHRHDREPA